MIRLQSYFDYPYVVWCDVRFFYATLCIVFVQDECNIMGIYLFYSVNNSVE